MSSLMFIISLFLTTLDFVLTPSIGRLGCLFEIFLVDLYCYKLPSESCFSIAHGFWQVFIFISICLQVFSDFLFNFFIDSLIFFFLTAAFFFLLFAKNYIPEFAKDLLKYIQGIHVPIKFVPSRL